MNVPADGGGYHLKYVPTNYEPLNTMRMTEYVYLSVEHIRDIITRGQFAKRMESTVTTTTATLQ